MDQTWKKDFQNNVLKQACIHEAGHIIVAKALGCSVQQTRADENGNGATTINYGKHNLMIIALSQQDNKSVAEYSQQGCFCKAVSLYVNVLLAGHIAEFLYEKNFLSSGQEDVTFDG